jgi:glutathionylspermidine synthase
MEIQNIAVTDSGKIFGTTSWDSDLKGNIYLSEHAFLLSEKEHLEIIKAQSEIVALLKLTQLLLSRYEEFHKWLDLPKELVDLSFNDGLKNYVTTYGRFDWVFDELGRLRLLEFNSETPMGWIESIKFTENAHKYYQKTKNVNNKLRDSLKQSIYERLISIGKLDGSIAIVGENLNNNKEESDTFNFLADIIKEITSEVIVCSVSELKAMTDYDYIDDGIYFEKDEMLYPIDTLMTFHSVEGLVNDDGGEQLIQLIEENKVSLMNPSSTALLHSKGLFAIIWHLYKTTNEFVDFSETIEKYIPFSTFNPDVFDKSKKLCVQKKLNHREGSSIEIKLISECKPQEDELLVFQDYIPVKKMLFDRLIRDEKGNMVKKTVKMQHTIGAYCILDSFAGYYTRLSEGICSAYDATFVPTFVGN